jgi:ribosomal protein L7/L12
MPPPCEELEQRVRMLLDQQRKIDAIKLYREETGAGLAEAKTAVEAMQAGGGLHIPQKNIPEGFEGDVLRLLSAGEKIQAIKLYRQQMGGGLKEAKQAVEALGERNGLLVRGSGCLGVMLMLVSIVFVSAVVFAGSLA